MLRQHFLRELAVVNHVLRLLPPPPFHIIVARVSRTSTLCSRDSPSRPRSGPESQLHGYEIAGRAHLRTFYLKKGPCCCILQGSSLSVVPTPWPSEEDLVYVPNQCLVAESVLSSHLAQTLFSKAACVLCRMSGSRSCPMPSNSRIDSSMIRLQSSIPAQDRVFGINCCLCCSRRLGVGEDCLVGAGTQPLSVIRAGNACHDTRP